MIRAVLIASACIIVTNGLWLLFVHFGGASSSAAVFLWASVPLAAAVAVATAPVKRKLFAALLVAPIAALSFAASNLLFEVLGHRTDFSGFTGALFVAGMALPVSLVLAALGGGATALFIRGSARNAHE